MRILGWLLLGAYVSFISIVALPPLWAADPSPMTPEDGFCWTYSFHPYMFAHCLADTLEQNASINNTKRLNVLHGFLDAQMSAQGNPRQIWAETKTNSRPYLLTATILSVDCATSQGLILLQQVEAVKQAAQEAP